MVIPRVGKDVNHEEFQHIAGARGVFGQTHLENSVSSWGAEIT